MKGARNGITAMARLAIVSTVLLAATSDAHGGPRAACRADVEKLCAGVPHGGGAIRKCLREHEDQVSEGCKQAIAHHPKHHQKEHPSGASEGGEH